MKFDFTWVGTMPTTAPRKWNTRTAAKNSGADRVARVAFRFDIAYVEIYDGLLLTDGRRVPIHTAYLHQFGRVIGLRDIGACDLEQDAVLRLAWVESFKA